MHFSITCHNLTPSISGHSSLSPKPLVINPQFPVTTDVQQLPCIPAFPVERPSVSFLRRTLRETLRFLAPLEASHGLSVSLQAKVCSSLMAGSQQKALAMAGVCTLLLLTFLASDVNAAGCSIAQLNQCTAAVTRGSPPTGACCVQVAGITDFNCFCNILLSQRNVPQDIINNAVHVPMKCGAQGVKLRNRQCGNIRIP